MEKQQKSKEYTLLVSDSYGNKNEKGTFEIAFRGWLVRELDVSVTCCFVDILFFRWPPYLLVYAESLSGDSAGTKVNYILTEIKNPHLYKINTALILKRPAIL